MSAPRPSPALLSISSGSLLLPPSSEAVWSFAPCLLKTELQNIVWHSFSLVLAIQQQGILQLMWQPSVPFCLGVILHCVRQSWKLTPLATLPLSM